MSVSKVSHALFNQVHLYVSYKTTILRPQRLKDEVNACVQKNVNTITYSFVNYVNYVNKPYTLALV